MESILDRLTTIESQISNILAALNEIKNEIKGGNSTKKASDYSFFDSTKGELKISNGELYFIDKNIFTADLSDVMVINVSGCKADNFLYKLFSENTTLVSLHGIDASDSDLSSDTLLILKNKTKFNGPLIRYAPSYVDDMKVAAIHVNIKNTYVNKDVVDYKFSRSDQKFPIIYKDDEGHQSEISYIHLQIVLQYY
jgi:hypothetical protein